MHDPSAGDSTPSHPGDETVVVRPSWRAYTQDLRKRAPFLIGVIPLVFAALAQATALNRGHVPGPLLALLAAIVAFLVIAVATLTLYYLVGTRLIATSSEVRVQRLFRRPSVVPIAQMHRIVRCTLIYSPDLSEPAVFAMDPGGRCVLSLYVGRWNWSDLEKLWQRLGIRVDGSWADQVPYQDVGSRFGVQS